MQFKFIKKLIDSRFSRSLFQGLSSLIFTDSEFASITPLKISGALPTRSAFTIERNVDGSETGTNFSPVKRVNCFASSFYNIDSSHLILEAKESNNRMARKVLAELLAFALFQGLSAHQRAVARDSRTVNVSAVRPLGVLNSSRIILIPIPSSSFSQRRRGYGHTELLAKELLGILQRGAEDDLGFHNSGIRGLSLLSSAVSREGWQQVSADLIIANLLRPSRKIADQTTIPFGERAVNMEGAYEVNEKLAMVLRGQADYRLILLDDVITSGATISEGIRALRGAGFEPEMAIAACVSARLFSE